MNIWIKLIITVSILLCIELTIADDSRIASQELTGADRELYQRAVYILNNDPEYERLGYSKEKFQYLVTKTDCLARAATRVNPSIDRRDLELVVQINDMESYRGTLIQELKAKKELYSELGSLAGYMKDFSDAIGDASYIGIIKTFASIGKDTAYKKWYDETNNYAFNHLYNSYEEKRKQGLDHPVAFDSVQEETGPYWQDWKKVFGAYNDLNEQTELNLNSETIKTLIGKYLESRYRTDKGGELANWEVPVYRPEHAMENLLRETIHYIKMKNKDKLWEAAKGAVDNAEAQDQGGFDPSKINLSGDWYSPNDATYQCTISGSNLSYESIGKNSFAEHKCTITYLKGSYYHVKCQDTPGHCCNNQGEGVMKVIDKDTTKGIDKWVPKNGERPFTDEQINKLVDTDAAKEGGLKRKGT